MRRASLGHTGGGLLQNAHWDRPPSSASFSCCCCKATTNLASSSSTSLSRAARSSLALVSILHHARSRGDHKNTNHYNSSPILLSCLVRRYCSVRAASPIPSCSSSAVVSHFGSALAAASSGGHRAVNFDEGGQLVRSLPHRALNFDEEGQHGRSSTLGGPLLTTWRMVGTFSSSGLAFWSARRSWLDSSGRGVGLQRGFCQGRAELAVMAASDGVPEGYRPNVGLCLVNDKDEVFVASRLDIPDSWQMPQGGVDDEEDPRHAAIRELREETGVTSVQHIGEVPEWLTYDFPPDVKTKISALWGTEWKGQAQKWFLFRFTGDESEITLAGDGSEKPEFGDWKWLPAEEVLKFVVDFKRPVYAQVFKALASHIDGWSKL